MSNATLWSVIDGAIPLRDDPERQIAALTATLSNLGVEQIEDFQAGFDRTMAESYSWDLWGAVYVANGGASDDGFEYFRRWLIAQGEAAFRQVSADPDSLGEIVPEDREEALEFEQIAYVARAVWSKKTGRSEEDMPFVQGSAFPAEPQGEPFDEDVTHLSRRYPKLWARFGGAPLW